MTLPGGAANVTAPAGMQAVLFPKSGPDGNPLNSGYGLTQGLVENSFRQTQVVDNPAVQDPRNQLYSGVGVPGIGLPFAIIGTIASAFTGFLGGWGSIGQATGAIGNTASGFEQSITEHTEVIANLADVVAAMGTTLAYVGDLQDMVTVPRDDLVCTGPAGFKSQVVTDFIVPGSYLTASCMPVIKPTTTVTTTLGTIYYSPIVVDRVGAIDKLRWIVGADTALLSIDYYEMALCVYNPDNGNIEKVYGSGNIAHTIASTTTLREVEIDMGIDQETTPGQILFVAHQQTASGFLQEARTFAAAPWGNIGRPPELLLDAACYTAPNYSQGIPSSISLESLTKENRFIPWSAISVISAIDEPEEPVTP